MTQMNEKFEYKWGDTVCVLPAPTASEKTVLPASVCGIREHDGQVMYLVEFSDGSTLELPEDRLVEFNENDSHNSLPLRDLN